MYRKPSGLRLALSNFCNIVKNHKLVQKLIVVDLSSSSYLLSYLQNANAKCRSSGTKLKDYGRRLTVNSIVLPSVPYDIVEKYSNVKTRTDRTGRSGIPTTTRY